MVMVMGPSAWCHDSVACQVLRSHELHRLPQVLLGHLSRALHMSYRLLDHPGCRGGCAFLHQDRIGEAEILDRFDQLFDGLLRVETRVVGGEFEPVYGNLLQLHWIFTPPLKTLGCFRNATHRSGDLRVSSP